VGAIPVDGSFGPITKKCVMGYQRTKNLEVDGVVGLDTWTAIITI
jgi:peptidoglycan hydrolase-like protein with peptidoglycan-binding domain